MPPNQAPLTIAELEERRRNFPQEVKSDPAREIFTLAVSVIIHFFGYQWYEDQVFQDAGRSKPDGFMRIDYTPGLTGEKKSSRILDFAENIFNLQGIVGFDDRVDQMKKTGSVEATFAEFDFGRFLYIHDIDFKFIVPSGVRGRDYDYGLRYSDGREACADAKCRLETTDIRPETIRNALEKARRENLPKNEPGIIFVKVPQTWVENEITLKGISETVREFLRNTRRIVSAIIYTAAVSKLEGQETTPIGLRFVEYDNPTHRFDTTKSWVLFRDFKVPDEWGGMPPKWHRIFSKGFIMRTR
jgi:hypothetical protein